jgi:hypothetical protein
MKRPSTMKKRTFRMICGVLAAGILLSSCVVHRESGNPHGLPPGQAKKIYGTKSAKPFAPGQQKKGY